MSFNIDSVSAAAGAAATTSNASDAKQAAAQERAPWMTLFTWTRSPQARQPRFTTRSQWRLGAPDRLADQNRTMHFHIDDSTGKLSVEVHDLQGNLLFTVPAKKALDVAAGGNAGVARHVVTPISSSGLTSGIEHLEPGSRLQITGLASGLDTNVDRVRAAVRSDASGSEPDQPAESAEVAEQPADRGSSRSLRSLR